MIIFDLKDELKAAANISPDFKRIANTKAIVNAALGILASALIEGQERGIRNATMTLAYALKRAGRGDEEGKNMARDAHRVMVARLKELRTPAVA